MKPPEAVPDWVIATVLGCVAIGLCVVLLFGTLFAYKSYQRYQKRADAKNAITVTHTKIEVANQQAKINRAQIAATKAEAEKRYQASIGIRRAQDEIAKTLTDKYLQHEAIEAQRESGNKQIYIPVGPQGIPLVKTAP